MMSHSRLDKIYRRMLITKFFEKGWGKPEKLKRLFEFRKFVSNRELCYNLIPRDYPVQLTREEKTSECHIIEGQFLTPMELYLPGLVPKEALQANFQVVLPLNWQQQNHKPICIHYAGTGDHFFWRRRHFLAKPLIREGNIGAILLENPYYGSRKPKEQVRSNLQNVSDIFVMGGCLILENLVLLHWCERNGFGPLGVSGLSMGGHMASLAATNWPKPLVLVPCLSWSTASSVFTQGVMSQSINWEMLETQYFADGNYCERLAKMVTVVDDSFVAGQQFVKQFNESMTELKLDLDDIAHTKVQSTKEDIAMDALFQKTQKNPKEAAEKILQINDELKKEVITENVDLALKQNGRKTKTNGDSKASTVYDSVSSVISTSTTNLMDLLLSNVSDNKPTKSPESIKSKPIDTTKVKWWERESLQFMRGMMDECTHLKNFSVPYDTSLITAICAKDDAYVPREGCSSLEDIWPGCEVKYLDAGHVSAYVMYHKQFRSSIVDGFERAKQIHETTTIERVPSITCDDLKLLQEHR